MNCFLLGLNIYYTQIVVNRQSPFSKKAKSTGFLPNKTIPLHCLTLFSTFNEKKANSGGYFDTVCWQRKRKVFSH